MPDIVDKTPEEDPSQFSATTPEALPVSALTRRLPPLVGDFSINFCRNPLCDLFGEYPYEYESRGRSKNGSKPNLGRGVVSGLDLERNYRCPSCNTSSILKSNIAIDEEYRRLVKAYTSTKQEHCMNEACENYDKPVMLHPSGYRKFGMTAKGDPRFQCKECRQTFSVGKANRRHKRKDLARKILRSVTNSTTFTAATIHHDIHINDVYRKLDYLHDLTIDFAAQRERELPNQFTTNCPFIQTDIQILKLNWSDRGVRVQVDVRHIVTVHRPTGFVIASTVDIDPDILPHAVEELADALGERKLPRSMRENARIWFPSEYLDFVRHRHQTLTKDYTPDELREANTKLLLRVGRVHQDIADFAHVMLVKHKIGDLFPHIFISVDRDAGLARAYCAVFKDEVKRGKATIAETYFDKNRTVQFKQQLVKEGRSFRDSVLGGIAASGWEGEVPSRFMLHEEKADLPDREMEFLVSQMRRKVSNDDFRRSACSKGIFYPFHFINEPNKRVVFHTDPLLLNDREIAEFVVRAGTHYVDAYHARSRVKVMGFERGLSRPGGRNYTYKQYYNPVRVLQMVDLFRFVHNYMNLYRNRKVADPDPSPATKIGLTNGYIYDRDLAI